MKYSKSKWFSNAIPFSFGFTTFSRQNKDGGKNETQDNENEEENGIHKGFWNGEKEDDFARCTLT